MVTKCLPIPNPDLNPGQGQGDQCFSCFSVEPVLQCYTKRKIAIMDTTLTIRIDKELEQLLEESAKNPDAQKAN